MSKKVLIKGTLILTTAGVLIKFLGFLFKIFLSERVKALVLSGCQYPCCCKQDDADEDDGCT